MKFNGVDSLIVIITVLFLIIACIQLFKHVRKFGRAALWFSIGILLVLGTLLLVLSNSVYKTTTSTKLVAAHTIYNDDSRSFYVYTKYGSEWVKNEQVFQNKSKSVVYQENSDQFKLKIVTHTSQRILSIFPGNKYVYDRQQILVVPTNGYFFVGEDW